MPGSSPYRGGTSGAEGRLVSFELVRAPRRSELASLRREWEETKPRLAGEHDMDTELRATWLAALLAAAYAGDPLRERAVLATALEGVTRAAYRARLCARLARAAAHATAFDLAAEWLALAPTDSGDAEADADVALARAMLDHARGDRAAARARLGAKPCSALGALLLADSLEAEGELASAAQVWRAATRAHGNACVEALGSRFDLASRTRRRLPRAALGTAAFLSAVASGVAWFLSTQ